MLVLRTKGNPALTQLLMERNRLLETYVRVSEKARQVTNAIGSCNVLFCSRTKVTSVFREDIQAISVLHSSCSDEREFSIKIGALAGLFEVELDPLRALLREKVEKNWKSTKLLEQWLTENGIAFDPNVFTTWRGIIELRNASFPYHHMNARVVEILQYFGHGFPLDFPRLYESILDRFLASLDSFQMALNAYLPSRGTART
jgi:hypothetical protein